MIETWKSIFFDKYLVSNLGQVRPKIYRIKSKIGLNLRQSTKVNGYCQVTLCANKKRVSALVHRLVAEAFLGKCPIGKNVNHVDGNKQNNKITNLEYTTFLQNEKHALVMGLKARGQKHGMATITDRQAQTIKNRLRLQYSRKYIAKIVKCSVTVVHLIANGRTWKHLT